MWQLQSASQQCKKKKDSQSSGIRKSVNGSGLVLCITIMVSNILIIAGKYPDQCDSRGTGRYTRVEQLAGRVHSVSGFLTMTHLTKLIFVVSDYFKHIGERGGGIGK